MTSGPVPTGALSLLPPCFLGVSHNGPQPGAAEATYSMVHKTVVEELSPPIQNANSSPLGILPQPEVDGNP